MIIFYMFKHPSSSLVQSQVSSTSVSLNNTLIYELHREFINNTLIYELPVEEEGINLLHKPFKGNLEQTATTVSVLCSAQLLVSSPGGAELPSSLNTLH